jgi:WD40 repeat protein
MLVKRASSYYPMVTIGILALSLMACQVTSPLASRTRKALIATFRGHTDAVSCVVFSPDGSTLASSSRDKTVRLWSVVEGKESFAFTDHSTTVYAVAFSSNGKLLASANGYYWAPSPPLRFGERGTAQTSTPINETPVHFEVILWDVAGNKHKYWETETPVYTVAFSPDGEVLAAGGGDPRRETDDAVWLWNGVSGELEATLSEHRNIIVWSIAFSPDGTTLASGTEQGVILWDVATAQMKGSLAKEMVRSVAFSPDGTQVAFGAADGTVHLWNIVTNREQAVIDKHDGIVYSLAFSPDGTILASGGKDGIVRFLDVTTVNVVGTVRIPQTSMVSVAFSPDGTLLASGSSDSLVRLWDVGQVLGR